MKLKHLFPFLLFLVLLSVQSGTKLIDWHESAPLKWSDFRGKIDSESPYDAWTYSGFNYNWSWFYDGDSIKADVNAYGFFDPEKSWVKKGKMSPLLLAHEQVHFDISELHARYFKEEMSRFAFTENTEAEADSIYDAVFARLLAMQIQYDEETEHFQNKEQQLSWRSFVTAELDRLK